MMLMMVPRKRWGRMTAERVPQGKETNGDVGVCWPDGGREERMVVMGLLNRISDWMAVRKRTQRILGKWSSSVVRREFYAHSKK